MVPPHPAVKAEVEDNVQEARCSLSANGMGTSLWISPGYEVVPGRLFWRRLGQVGRHSCGLEPLQNYHKPNAWSSVTQIPNTSFPIPCSKLS